MFEGEIPSVDYQKLPEVVQGTVSAAFHQIESFLKQTPPALDPARKVVSALDAFLNQQTEGESAEKVSYQQLIAVFQEWVTRVEQDQKNKERQQQRVAKMKEVEDFWQKVNIFDAFSVLNITYDRTVDDDALRKQIRTAFRLLSRQFHSDVNQQILEGESDELEVELDQIFKLANMANTWLDKWIEGKKPTWFKFEGFGRYEGRQEPKQERSGSAARNEQGSGLNYDVFLRSVEVSKLKIGDYIHFTTRSGYLIYEVTRIQEGKPFVELRGGGSGNDRITFKGTIYSSSIKSQADLNIMGSASFVEGFQISRSGTKKPEMDTSKTYQDTNGGGEERGYQRPRLEYDQKLTAIIFSDLSVGDYLHLKTENSYYVFQVYMDRTGKLGIVYSSGPGKLREVREPFFDNSLNVGQRFNIDAEASTSPIEQIQVSHSPNRKNTMENEQDRVVIEFDTDLNIIDSIHLQRGDYLHISTTEPSGPQYYIFEMTRSYDDQLYATCVKGPQSLLYKKGIVGSLFTKPEGSFQFAPDGVNQIIGPVEKIQVSKLKTEKDGMNSNRKSKGGGFKKWFSDVFSR